MVSSFGQQVLKIGSHQMVAFIFSLSGNKCPSSGVLFNYLNRKAGFTLAMPQYPRGLNTIITKNNEELKYQESRYSHHWLPINIQPFERKNVSFVEFMID